MPYSARALANAGSSVRTLGTSRRFRPGANLRDRPLQVVEPQYRTSACTRADARPHGSNSVAQMRPALPPCGTGGGNTLGAHR